MNLLLIGYCGSGKAAVGKLLADALWMDFVDASAGDRPLDELLACDGRVIATSESPELPANRSNCKVICLRAESAIQASRAADEGKLVEPVKFEQALAEWLATYRPQADVSVDTTYLTPQQTIQQIVRMI